MSIKQFLFYRLILVSFQEKDMGLTSNVSFHLEREAQHATITYCKLNSTTTCPISPNISDKILFFTNLKYLEQLPKLPQLPHPPLIGLGRRVFDSHSPLKQAIPSPHDVPSARLKLRVTHDLHYKKYL